VPLNKENLTKLNKKEDVNGEGEEDVEKEEKTFVTNG
jgi:hypothetical protein